MRLAINGTHLNVEERGEGDLALVFLRYFGGAGRAWSAVADHLTGTYRCIVPDLHGFGDSDAPPTGYAMDAAADDVIGITRALRLE